MKAPAKNTSRSAPPSAPSWWSENWKMLALVWLVSLLPFLPVLFSGRILLSSDQMGAPAWNFYFDALRHGEIPLWRPNGIGGMPTFDAMFGDASYPPFVLLGFLLPVKYIVTCNFVLHVLVAGFSAFVLARRYFRLDGWIAAPLALAYALNPHFISYIYGGHTGKFHIMAWLPLSLYFLLRVLGPSSSWKHALGLSLTVALFVLTTHLQFAYFVMMGFFLVWLYFLFPALRAGQWRTAASLVPRFWVPVLLGVGLAFFIFYPPMQYTKEFGIRGSQEKSTYEHATSWSIHPEETAALLVPEFVGIRQSPSASANYWGRNYFKLNTEYPGLFLWFLALFGLFAFRTKWYGFWSGLSLLAVLFGLAANTPVFRLFYEFVPGIKNFRAAGMMLFWLGMALFAMSGETVRRLMSTGPDALSGEHRRRLLKRFRLVGAGVAVLCALFGLFPGAVYTVWNSFVNEPLIPNLHRQGSAAHDFAMGSFRTAVLLGVLTASVSAFLLRAHRPRAFGLAALAVVAADTFWVNSNFIQGYDVGPTLAAEPAVEYLKTDTSRFRVFGVGDVYPAWYLPYHGIETVEGWTDNEMRHYRAYRGGDYSRNPNFFAGLRQNSDGTVSGSPFLDLLNVKYLAFRVPDDPGIKLALNASVLPRAFFVPAWEAVADSQALRRMKEPGFDPRRMAYVTGEGLVSGGGAADSAAPLITATETTRKINRQAYSVEAPSEGVLVLSDLWFPHWKARVDGETVPLVRANFAFRGVLLKAGRHEVEVEYHSSWLRKGLQVSVLSLAALALYLWVLARLAPKRAP